MRRKSFPFTPRSRVEADGKMTGPKRTRARRLVRSTGAVFLFYFLLSLVFFGRGLIRHFSDRYIGIGYDPSLQIWYFAWFYHALVHHLNPFIADVVWAPQGFNVAWSHTSPLAEVLLAPITGVFSPVVSYNLVELVSLALAGWFAFILCRHVTNSFWPALAGGYVFAFSPYTLSHILGQTSLLMVSPIPLAAWLALLRLEDRIGRASFAAWLALTVTAQFLLDIEVLATATLFGAGALALGWYLATPEYRTKLRQLVTLALWSYIAAGLCC